MSVSDCVTKLRKRAESLRRTGNLSPEVSRSLDRAIQLLRELESVPARPVRVDQEGRRVLSTHEAARRLGVTPMTVIRWFEEGRLVGYRTAGGHRRVQEESVAGMVGLRGMRS